MKPWLRVLHSAPGRQRPWLSLKYIARGWRPGTPAATYIAWIKPRRRAWIDVLRREQRRGAGGSR